MYKEEVTDPRLAEAYATVTLNLAGSGFSLKKMAQGESKVSVTKSPGKSKLAGIIEGEVKGTGTSGNAVGANKYRKTSSIDEASLFKNPDGTIKIQIGDGKRFIHLPNLKLMN